MKTDPRLVDALADLYRWIDRQVTERGQSCDACGKCCDFDSFDHRLFVTTPELAYFALQISPRAVRAMPTGTCPYNIEGRCSVYSHRFAGCRIFTCGGDSDFQNNLSEQAVERLKAICLDFDMSYRYTDLKVALNQLAETLRPIE